MPGIELASFKMKFTEYIVMIFDGICKHISVYIKICYPPPGFSDLATALPLTTIKNGVRHISKSRVLQWRADCNFPSETDWTRYC